jgi:hypothetical protein
MVHVIYGHFGSEKDGNVLGTSANGFAKNALRALPPVTSRYLLIVDRERKTSMQSTAKGFLALMTLMRAGQVHLRQFLCQDS